jgi:hypothetical protein
MYTEILLYTRVLSTPNLSTGVVFLADFGVQALFFSSELDGRQNVYAVFVSPPFPVSSFEVRSLKR